jgi:hypothetical protein
MPVLARLFRRDFDPGLPALEFSAQWTCPTDVFSVLLILGGDVVARALAQLVGSRVTPVAFSFGTSSFSSQVLQSVSEPLKPPPTVLCSMLTCPS